MDYMKALEDTRAFYYEKRTKLTKDEMSYLLGRDRLKGKLLGFMEGRYYKRRKLLLEGEVIYGYVFQEYDPAKNAPYKAIWVLHSPSLEYQENPKALFEVARSIEEAQIDKKVGKILLNFMKKVKEELSEGFYIEVPSRFTGGDLVYLSIPYLKKDRFEGMRLGPNFFVAAPMISKDLWPLPASYLPLDVYKEYLEGDI